MWCNFKIQETIEKNENNHLKVPTKTKEKSSF